MTDDSHSQDEPAGGKRRRRHDPQRQGWPGGEQVKRAPRPAWSGKTMHHPAFRVGEIKHGKS